MIPGQLEPRRSNAVTPPAPVAAPRSPAEAVRPPDQRRDQATWVEVSICVAALLATMLLAMWAARAERSVTMRLEQSEERALAHEVRTDELVTATRSGHSIGANPGASRRYVRSSRVSSIVLRMSTGRPSRRGNFTTSPVSARTVTSHPAGALVTETKANGSARWTMT